MYIYICGGDDCVCIEDLLYNHPQRKEIHKMVKAIRDPTINVNYYYRSKRTTFSTLPSHTYEYTCEYSTSIKPQYHVGNPIVISNDVVTAESHVISDFDFKKHEHYTSIIFNILQNKLFRHGSHDRIAYYKRVTTTDIRVL